MIMGRATIVVPSTDNLYEITETGLSDAMAISYGRLFAMTLSEQDGFVTVTLESGLVKLIGLDTVTGELTIGRLSPKLSDKSERECYGTI